MIADTISTFEAFDTGLPVIVLMVFVYVSAIILLVGVFTGMVKKHIAEGTDEALERIAKAVE